MEIILIRHAQAEDKRENLQDLERHLTDEGKKTIGEIMPKLEEKISPLEKRKLVLWSSPANRALDTAQLVASYFDMDVNSICDFIYEGNFEKLINDVQDIDTEATLLVVGHEPSLSEWVTQMTDEQLKIKKGSVLSFKVLDLSTLESELQWVITPN